MLWQHFGNIVSNLTKFNVVTTLPQHWALARLEARHPLAIRHEQLDMSVVHLINKLNFT